jgi:hypothetical protein
MEACGVAAEVGERSDPRFGSFRTVPLDDYIPLIEKSGGRLKAVKVDVDGPELQVLQGATKLLEIFHPLLVVELNKEQEEIVELLRRVGYTSFFDTSGVPIEVGAWPENLVASLGEVAAPARGCLAAFRDERFGSGS